MGHCMQCAGAIVLINLIFNWLQICDWLPAACSQHNLQKHAEIFIFFSSFFLVTILYIAF